MRALMRTDSRTAVLENGLPDDFPASDMWKPVSLVVLAVLPLLVVLWFPGWWYASWPIVVPIAVLVALIGVMLWPSAGLTGYFEYKRPLFVFTIVFEMWIVVAGLALVLPSSVSDANFWFQLALVGFFIGTAMISLPGLEGDYRKGLFFRPDLLYGNGAYLARGEIFVALGIKLFISGETAHPIWNWWGLEWALASMVFMVPFRGILKMRMRRARFLDLDNWMGKGAGLGLWVKEVFLFVSLIMLVYGFANAYMGVVPFTWTPGYPMSKSTGPEWWGLAIILISFIIIVPIRGWYKTRVVEPTPLKQELVKGGLLWIGFLILIYGFLKFFQGTGWAQFYGPSSPNFWWATWTAILGFFMIVPLRAYSLRQEFGGTVRMMVFRMADLPEGQRRLMMGRRLAVIAAMPERSRRDNLRWMGRFIQDLPDESRRTVVATRTRLLADAPTAQRSALMSAMTGIFAEMVEDERLSVMSEIMESIVGLPEEKRRIMVAAMSEAMSD